MRQMIDSKTSLSGEESYEDYVRSIPKREKAKLYTILSRLQVEGKEALKYLEVSYLQESKVMIQVSRWKIWGYVSGERFVIETVEDKTSK